MMLMSVMTQAQYINMTDGSFMRITGGAVVVIDSNTPNTVTKTGNTGGIITDSEDDIIRWNIDNSVGTFMIPFASTAGNTLRFTYQISNAGTGGGYLTFTSYETLVNNTIIPSGVTHITNDYGFDNSPYVIDRFWIISPTGYTSKPEGTYTFTYDDADLIGNTITESSLTAQRFNDDDDLWLDWLYAPLVNTTSNTLSIVVANPLDQYPVWTLVDVGSPLPIELIRFTVDCDELTLHWVTASETNTDVYIIQGSNDAVEWSDIGEVDAAGNSNQLLNYSFKASPYSYYRLNQIDFDGTSNISDVIFGCPDVETNTISLYPNPNDGRFFVSHTSVYNFDVYDMFGRIVWSEKTSKNYFDMTNLAGGEYHMRAFNETENHLLRFIKIK